MTSRAVGLLTLCLLAFAPAAVAQELPKAGSLVELDVLRPTDVIMDPFQPGMFVVSSAGPPPAIVVAEDVGGDVVGRWQIGDTIPLPAGCDPRTLYFDDVGFLHIICADGRTFRLDLPSPALTETTPLPDEVEFPTGAAQGFNTEVVSDFGNGNGGPGSLFYGPGFASQLPFGGTIVPNGVDLLPDTGRTSRGRVPSEFVLINAQGNTVLEIADLGMPRILDTEPGAPGGPTQPARDITVDPLNLTAADDRPSVHPILVSSPDLGNVFWSPGPGGPWSPISPTPFGRPVRVAASCDILAVTDFTNSKVTVFEQDPPRKAECEDIFDLIVEPGSGAPFSLSGKLILGFKAIADAEAQAKVRFATLRGSKASASAVVSNARARLRAGRVSRARVRFSRAETSRIAQTMRLRGRVRGSVSITLRNRAGSRTRRVYRVTLRGG